MAGLVLALGGLLALWLSVDRRPPEWDHANHLERALTCHRILADPGRDRLREILEISTFYPPAVGCAAGLLYFFLPVSPWTSQVVMLGALALALGATAALGSRLWDRPAGHVAVWLLATAPFVVHSLTTFQLDLPLTAVVALTLLAVLRSDRLARPGWAAALGPLLALGLLTKPTFLLYVGPVLAGLGWQALRGRERRPGRLALALGVGALLALPWYGPRLIGLPAQLLNRSFKNPVLEGQPEFLSGASLAFYPLVLGPQAGFLLALPACLGLWAVRRDRDARWLLWLATLPPFVIVTFIANKNLRYTLPMLPALALLAVAGLRALPASWRRPALAAVLGLGVLQVSMAAFGLPEPPLVRPFLTPLVVANPPQPGDWQHARMLGDIASLAGQGAPGATAGPPRVAVVPNFAYLSTSTLRYEARRLGVALTVTRGWDGPPFELDFVVMKTGSQGPVYTAARPERLVRAFAEDAYLAGLYPVAGEYPLPDGSRATLRARRIDPLPLEAASRLARLIENDAGRHLALWVREPVGLGVRVEAAPADLAAGRIARLTLSAEHALVGEVRRRDRPLLRVRRVRLVAEDLLVDPRRLLERGDLEVLELGGLRIERLLVTEPDLAQFIHGQRAGGLRVRLDDGWARVEVTSLVPPIEARLRLTPGADGRSLALEVRDLSLGPVPVPDLFVHWIVRNFDPTPRLGRLPVAVALGPVSIRPGRLEVGPPEPSPGN